MTATFTPAEIRDMGFEIVGDRLVRVSGQGDRARSPKSDESSTSGASPAPDQNADSEGTWQQAQKDCYAVFKNAGCEVYWLSQARRTGQTAGVPDLIVFGPPGAAFHLYWETKHGQGKLSDAQRKFALHCQRTNTLFAAGGKSAARRILKSLIQSLGGGDV